MDFNFCPKCGGELYEGQDDLSGVPICKGCNFKFFQNSRPTVVALIEDENGRILLIKRAFEPQKGMLGLVGGFLELGEEVIDGLCREVKEELKVDLKDINFFDIFTNNYLHDPKIKNAYTLDIYFTCKIIGVPEVSEEVDEINFFEKDEIPWNEIAFESNKKALKKYLSK